MDIILAKVEECKKDVLYRLLQYPLFEDRGDFHVIQEYRFEV